MHGHVGCSSWQGTQQQCSNAPFFELFSSRSGCRSARTSRLCAERKSANLYWPDEQSPRCSRACRSARGRSASEKDRLSPEGRRRHSPTTGVRSQATVSASSTARACRPLNARRHRPWSGWWTTQGRPRPCRPRCTLHRSRPRHRSVPRRPTHPPRCCMRVLCWSDVRGVRRVSWPPPVGACAQRLVAHFIPLPCC